MNNRKMNCAESVLEALIRSGAVDVPIETVACATGFGGGGGGVGFTCGALTSAMLANSMVYGRKDPSSSPDKSELKEKHYRRYNNIVSDFVKVAGSGLCREIVNEFPEGQKDSRTRPNCIRISVEAAGIAVDFLQKKPEEAAMLEYDPAVVGVRGWTP